MSIPFSQTKKEAEEFWKDDPVIKVLVPKDRGFLQAREGGEYWICEDYTKRLGLAQLKDTK